MSSVLAITTAVASPRIISRAKLGPLRKAARFFSPNTSMMISFMRANVSCSTPLVTERMGTCSGMRSRTESRNLRDDCMGTACTT